MKLAAQIGIPLSEFWEMTLAELHVYSAGYSERKKAEYEAQYQQNSVLAFLISRWVWDKKVDISKHLETLNDKKDSEKTDKKADAWEPW